MRAAAPLLILGTVVGGCTKRNIVECATSETCVAFVGGQCLTNEATDHQWCAYPDALCASGMRWSEANTGDDLAGECVGDINASPDASGCETRIAWVHDDEVGAGYNIWTGLPDASDQRPLTEGAAFSEAPAWSPDGERIAYVRDGAIWIMNADGSDPHPITSGGPDGLPVWSPDGARIAFDRGATGNRAIWSVSPDGSDLVQLSDADTSNARRRVSWAPDSTALAFTSDRDGNTEIYRMQANGAGEVNLSQSPQNDGDPQWSPDGSLIAFVSSRGGYGDLWVIEADGSNPRTLQASEMEQLLGHVWSPDGSRLYFARLGDQLMGALHEVNADGTGLRALGPVTGMDMHPAVSADGTVLAFSRISTAAAEIWVVNSDGSNPIRITNNATNDESPTWRPCP